MEGSYTVRGTVELFGSGGDGVEWIVQTKFGSQKTLDRRGLYDQDSYDSHEIEVDTFLREGQFLYFSIAPCDDIVCPDANFDSTRLDLTITGTPEIVEIRPYERFFWTEFDTATSEGSLFTAPLGDQSRRAELPTDNLHQAALAVDGKGRKLYSGGNRIWRMNLDGSEREAIWHQPMRWVTVDEVGRRLYGSTDTGMIRRFDLETGALETEIDMGIHAGVLAIDSANGKMYFTSRDTSYVHRANLDGSEVENVVHGGSWPRGIDIDTSQGRIYWSDFSGGWVYRANPDGSFRQPFHFGDSPLAVEVDEEENAVYLGVFGDRRVVKRDLTSGHPTVYANTPWRPIGIAIASVCTYHGFDEDADTHDDECFETAAYGVQSTLDVIDTLDLSNGAANALTSRLEDALAKLTDSNPNNDGGAASNLMDFLVQVEAKRGKHIDDAVADLLLRRGVAVLEAL